MVEQYLKKSFSAKQNQTDEVIKLVKYVGIGVVAYLVLKPVLASAASVADSVTAKAENVAKQQLTGLTSQQLILCKSVSKNVDAAMNSGAFGLFEDEDAVVDELNKLITTDMAMQCSVEYKTSTSRSLLRDVKDHLSKSDQDRILQPVYTGLT